MTREFAERQIHRLDGFPYFKLVKKTGIQELVRMLMFCQTEDCAEYAMDLLLEIETTVPTPAVLRRYASQSYRFYRPDLAVQKKPEGKAEPRVKDLLTGDLFA